MLSSTNSYTSRTGTLIVHRGVALVHVLVGWTFSKYYFSFLICTMWLSWALYKK